MANLTNGTARLRLIRLVFAGAVVSFLTLGIVSKVYELASEPVIQGFKVLLGIYLPLIAVMLGFYQDQANQVGSDEAAAQQNMLTFVTYFVGLWVLLPVILIAGWDSIEDAVNILEWTHGTAGALVAAAVGLFFAKTGPKQQPSSGLVRPEPGATGAGTGVSGAAGAASTRIPEVAEEPELKG